MQRTLGNRATARLLAGRRAVVQRKVGLEFETAHEVREERPGETDVRQLGYNEKVFGAKAGTWKIVADSSNFEFVTEPVDETDQGRESLKTIIAEMRQFIDALLGMRAGSGLDALEEDWAYVSRIAPSLGDTLLGKKDAVRITPIPVGQRDLGANPQATGGVPLDKIADLVTAINTTQLAHLQNKREERGPLRFGKRAIWDEKEYAEDERSLTGMNPLAGEALSEASHWASKYVETVLKGLAKDPEWRKSLEKRGLGIPDKDLPNLRGLLTLVMSYLIRGDEQQTVWEYSKIIAPLMSRTNFSALYAALPAEEREFFDAEFILHVLSLNKDEPIFAVGYGDEDKPDRGPKRGEWLDSIKRKSIDLMSLGGGSTVTAGHVGSSSSMGAQAKPDTGVSGTPLAVLELRRLPQEQNPDEWEKTAMVVFDVFKLLSNPEPAPKEPSKLESAAEPKDSAPESSTPSAPSATTEPTTPTATSDGSTSNGST